MAWPEDILSAGERQIDIQNPPFRRFNLLTNTNEKLYQSAKRPRPLIMALADALQGTSFQLQVQGYQMVTRLVVISQLTPDIHIITWHSSTCWEVRRKRDILSKELLET